MRHTFRVLTVKQDAVLSQAGLRDATDAPYIRAL